MNKLLNLVKKVLESNIRLFAVGKKQWLDLVNSIKELSQYKLGFVDANQSFILKYKIALQIETRHNNWRN